MKILFINFNIGSTPGINNGIAILSAILKKRGHKVGLIFICDELGYDFDLLRIKKDIIDFKPDIVAISLMEPQLQYMRIFCDDLKTYYKGFVVCGGPHPTMSPEDILAIEGIHAVCLGEGDVALPELAEALADNKDYRRIRNLWFSLPDGKIIKNKLRPFVDLNDLPPEDKNLFPLSKIIPAKNYQLEMTLGRGCVYQCSYCINRSYFDKYKRLCDEVVSLKTYIRMKSPDVVVREIKDTILVYPEIKKIAFIDDNFVMHDKFLEDFCAKYKKEIDLPFMCNANPMSFNKNKCILLKEAGCDDIRFGVESGSERVKKEIMKRPVTNNKVIKVFETTKESGIMTSSFNIIGLPTESKDEVFETLKLNAFILPDTVKLMTFYPFKNTPLYDLCKKHDLIDVEKKNKLDNYNTVTCLKFSAEHQLFLRKVQASFNWYINIFLDNQASLEYKSLVNEIEAMAEDEWNQFDFFNVDKDMSERMRKREISHYSKFLNGSLAVKFPSRHFI